MRVAAAVPSRSAAFTARQARPDEIRRVRGVLETGIPNRCPKSSQPSTRLSGVTPARSRARVSSERPIITVRHSRPSP
jgi:hypothetical protein